MATNEVDTEDADHNVIPGSWRNNANLLRRLQNRRGTNATHEAKSIRDYLAFYYSSEAGSVPWQDRMVYPRGRPIDEDMMGE